MSDTNVFPVLGVQGGLLIASGSRATTNTVPATYEIEGPFTDSQIVAAVGEIVRRQHGLRTVFEWSGGRMVQRVTAFDRVDSCLQRVDWRGRPGITGRVAGMITAFLGFPFDLGAAPPFRGFLARVGDNRSILGLTFAHVAIDGASIGIFAEELAAALGGVPRPAPLQPGQLALREQLIVPTPEQASAWREQYARSTPLPRRWAGGPGTWHNATVPTFDARLVIALDQLKDDLGVSITTVLAAVAALASARHLSIPNPMIGLATSQRDRDGVVNGNQLTIGTVHDHLPVLAEVPRDATFARVVADLHKRRTEARRHRLPTGRLEQYAGGAVPYGIAVNFGRFGSPAPIPVHGGGTVLAMPVEEVGPVNLEEATTAAPALAWIASREGPTIRGFVIGISGLYEAATVARYAQALSTNALAVTQQPYRRLSEFVPF